MITVSLEKAKELKENGWEKETAFYWTHNTAGVEKDHIKPKEQTQSRKLSKKIQSSGCIKYYAGAMAQEILDELPYKIDDGLKYQLNIIKGEGSYIVTYLFRGLKESTLGRNNNENLANALADLRIRCKKERYIE